MTDFQFSVAMCVYDGDNPQWFSEAVHSVLHQTRKPDEIVLVVDGPVKEELDVFIRALSEHNNFKVIRLAQNQGHGAARSRSVSACTYPYVAIMDADDIAVPTRFEKQISYIRRNPDVTIVGGQIEEFVGTPENIVGKRIVPGTDAELKEYCRKRCPFNQVTVMFRKDDILQVGNYKEWFCNEDYYLWLRLLQAGKKFANLQETLVKVRVGEDMYRRRGGWKYFKSEAKLQQYMLKHHIISIPLFAGNICKRLIVQVLLPTKIRGWFFAKFAREQ